eukprot:COSAG02_NODE_2329_length_9121_cov_3.015183_8_plen_154_part_00
MGVVILIVQATGADVCLPLISRSLRAPPPRGREVAFCDPCLPLISRSLRAPPPRRLSGAPGYFFQPASECSRSRVFVACSSFMRQGFRVLGFFMVFFGVIKAFETPAFLAGGGFRAGVSRFKVLRVCEGGFRGAGLRSPGLRHGGFEARGYAV